MEKLFCLKRKSKPENVWRICKGCHYKLKWNWCSRSMIGIPRRCICSTIGLQQFLLDGCELHPTVWYGQAGMKPSNYSQELVHKRFVQHQQGFWRFKVISTYADEAKKKIGSRSAFELRVDIEITLRSFHSVSPDQNYTPKIIMLPSIVGKGNFHSCAFTLRPTGNWTYRVPLNSSSSNIVK